MEHANSSGCVVCDARYTRRVLLVCDGCVKVDDEPPIWMVVGVEHVDMLILRDSRDLCDVGDHWFDDDENGWSMLSQE